eukprot:g77782.t1
MLVLLYLAVTSAMTSNAEALSTNTPIALKVWWILGWLSFPGLALQAVYLLSSTVLWPASELLCKSRGPGHVAATDEIGREIGPGSDMAATQRPVADMRETLQPVGDMAVKVARQQPPKVAVIIAAYNEEVGVRATVESVLATQYEQLVEVIVVDDGSKDRTREILNEMVLERERMSEMSTATTSSSLSSLTTTTRSSSQVKLRVVSQPNGGKASALNRGLAIVSPEVQLVCTVDADSVMAPSHLPALAARYTQNKRLACVAGNTVIGARGLSSAFITLVQELEFLLGFFVKKGQSCLHSVWVVGGANASYRKDALIALGGFPEGLLTEDLALTFAFLARGLEVGYEPEAVVFTEGPSTWRGLCRQRFRWTYGKFQTWQLFLPSMLFASHHFFFTWFHLPIAIYNECVLMLSLPLLLFTFYVALAIELGAGAFAVAVFSTCVLITLAWLLESSPTSLSPSLRRYHGHLLLLAPAASVLLTCILVVEVQASVRGLWALARGRRVSWGNWNRSGVMGS